MDYLYTVCTPTIDTQVPDVFSFSTKLFSQFDETKVVWYDLTDLYAKRFDLLTLNVYQTNQYDKLVLWYNKIPSTFHLVSGLRVALPDLEDIRRVAMSNWYM